MKKLSICLLALCITAGLAACGPTDDEIKAVREVSFEGAELTVTLGSNKSTGYEWDYEIYGECIEPSINRSFKILGSRGDATGTLSVGFEGRSGGEAIIVFTTPNGWDGAGEGDAYTVGVSVGEGGAILSAEGEQGAHAPEAKTALTVSELADGAYAGTLSGGSYSGSEDESVYIINTDISPAEISVVVRGGLVELYCAADASSGGEVLGVEAPRSPSYTQTVSGTLPLSQIDEKTVRAEGDLTASGEEVWIYWDSDKRFTHWDIKPAENDIYHCSVSIAMSGGVPTAEITVDGSSSHRTATVPLELKA